MSNNYQLFSAGLDLENDQEKDWCEARLEELRRTREEDASPIPEEGVGFDGEGEIERYESRANFPWNMEVQRDTGKPFLWFHSEESGNIDQIAEFVSEFLAKFQPDKCWTLEWANTCDRPRIDEFGGGAVFVTAKKITWMSTDAWCRKQKNAFNKRRNRG